MSDKSLDLRNACHEHPYGCGDAHQPPEPIERMTGKTDMDWADRVTAIYDDTARLRTTLDGLITATVGYCHNPDAISRALLASAVAGAKQTLEATKPERLR